METTLGDGTALSRRLRQKMFRTSLLRGHFRQIRLPRSNRHRYLLTAYFTSPCLITSGLSTPARGTCSGTTTNQPTMATISDSVESPCTKVGFITLLPTAILFR